MRRIRFRDVRTAIEQPDQIRTTTGGAIEAIKRMGGKRLVIIFEAARDVRTIITAYYEN
jgi:hypothetical protein